MWSAAFAEWRGIVVLLAQCAFAIALILGLRGVRAWARGRPSGARVTRSMSAFLTGALIVLGLVSAVLGVIMILGYDDDVMGRLQSAGVVIMGMVLWYSAWVLARILKEDGSLPDRR